MAWCHLAKNNMTGSQTRGNRWLWDKDISYDTDISRVFGTANKGKGSSCMVFSQTPIVHVSKKSRKVDQKIVIEGNRMCNYFQRTFGTIEFGGLHTVSELFNYKSARSNVRQS